MKVVSVNVGLPRTVDADGKAVLTSIFKQPVAGRVAVRRLNLDGDRQADLSVHGGPEKAVYAYPAEHYGFWDAEMPMVALPWGQFGENLSVEGMLETELYIGDRFRAGTAELVVTQPRIPCYKLGIRFGRPDIVRRFLKSGRTGFYCAVSREGDVAAGDPITLVERARDSLTVAEITRLYRRDDDDLNLLRRTAGLALLPAAWRDHFRRVLDRRT